MGKSYRKPYSSVCSSKGMKEWRTQENRRLRHNAKQLINTCEDYDALIIPVINEYGTLWSSPQDGRKWYYDKPLMNQCEIDFQRHKLRFGTNGEWAKTYWGFDGEHYTKSVRACTCYSNKRSWYWKLRRK